MIQLSLPSLSYEEEIELSRVLKTGYLGQGPEVLSFEQELAEYLELSPQNVACVNSGTAALHLALESLNLQAGDEVLVPTLTYIATYQAISAAGLVPISCDVNMENGLIDLKDAARRVSPRTKVLLIVNYASQRIDPVKVQDFKNKYNLSVIEDAAHSFGTELLKNKVGEFTDLTCFSFDPIKNITCGEGGAVVSKNAQRVAQIKVQRKLGLGNFSPLEVDLQGWRYHMSDLNAAIGRVQLRNFIKFSREKRRQIYNLLKETISDIPEIQPLSVDANQLIAPHIFVIKVPRHHRDALIIYLFENQIESRVHYPLNHIVKKYKTNYQLPNAEKLISELVSLPLHLNLNSSDILKLKKTIVSFFKFQNSSVGSTI